jgi:hypothetical protein
VTALVLVILLAVAGVVLIWWGGGKPYDRLDAVRKADLAFDGFRRSCACTASNICRPCYDLLPASHIDKHCRFNALYRSRGSL